MACLILAEKEVKFTERTILTASHRQTAERLTKEDVARGTLVIYLGADSDTHLTARLRF